MKLVNWDPFNSQIAAYPVVDAFNRDGDLVVRAELPGMKKDEIKIDVVNSLLVIEGERTREEEIREDNAYRLERVYGQFSRRFRLPKGIDVDGIRASYKDGILEVTLPRAEESKPRKIEIQAA